MINFLGFTFAFTFILIFCLIVIGIWIWALVDCIRSEMDTVTKLIWVLIILIFNIIGAIVYFLFKRSEKAVKHTNTKKLVRSDDKIIAGVCAGIADYFGIDPTIVRLLWILLTIFSVGTGVILYIIAAIIIPHEKAHSKETDSAVKIITAIAAVLIVLILCISLIAIIAILNYGTGGVSVSKQAVSHAIDEKQRAIMMAADTVRLHDAYKEFKGQNLRCNSIEKVKHKACTEFHDPLGITRYEDCYKIRCQFDSNVEGEHVAEVIYARNTIRNISFDLALPPKNDSLKPICVDMCGDGVCQEMVCMGEECPCPEDSVRCSSDC